MVLGGAMIEPCGYHEHQSEKSKNGMPNSQQIDPG
jgi:hypothetical protein